jgi:hypothetical protein
MDCAVFIVGCPRSGTTLLRLMMDSHPALAIPDESHFIVDLDEPGVCASRSDRESLLERILAHERFLRWGFDADRVRELAEQLSPSTYPEVIGTVFAAYAGAHGKRRWGDKSPQYVQHIPRLAAMFPSARFVQIIRDGRAVAASLDAHDWGTPTAVAGSQMWQKWVTVGRTAGREQGPDRYLEIRLEELVRCPESVLREVCAFLHEPYSPAMLDYHRTAAERVWTGDPGDPKAVDHRYTREPPTPGLRDWRAGMSPEEQGAVEAAAQPLLGELGYVD